MAVTMEDKELEMLTINEVAELLSVTRQTVNTLLKTGKLKKVKIGERAVRVSRADLEAFIRKGRGD
jgi:excisionase family DNA binding protein|tara:strand:- start:864 stop:1061 length:198 start_codon:yes stop_codon:yes gene_type:complete